MANIFANYEKPKTRDDFIAFLSNLETEEYTIVKVHKTLTLPETNK